MLFRRAALLLALLSSAARAQECEIQSIVDGGRGIQVENVALRFASYCQYGINPGQFCSSSAAPIDTSRACEFTFRSVPAESKTGKRIVALPYYSRFVIDVPGDAPHGARWTFRRMELTQGNQIDFALARSNGTWRLQITSLLNNVHKPLIDGVVRPNQDPEVRVRWAKDPNGLSTVHVSLHQSTDRVLKSSVVVPGTLAPLRTLQGILDRQGLPDGLELHLREEREELFP